jgi:hypothetical protein
LGVKPLRRSASEDALEASAQLVADGPERLELLVIGPYRPSGIREPPVDAMCLAEEHRADLLGT